MIDFTNKAITTKSDSLVKFLRASESAFRI